jgi:hypothetical protein
MSKYQGKNEIKKTKRLAHERAKYKLGAFKDELGEVPKNVKDFNFSDRTLYGRVDENLDTIYPKELYLKPMAQEQDIFFVVDFVKEQFTLFKNKIRQAVNLRSIPADDPFLSEIKIYKAYEDPINLYRQYIEDHIENFNSGLNPRKITSYDDWCMEFLRVSKDLKTDFPITLSGFQRTNRSNIFTSGLAISISNLDYGNDEHKSDFFLENKTLQFYTNVAKQFGFYVNKSCPWILVSDLNSPATTVYRKNLDLSSLNKTFIERYELCYNRDILHLRQVLEDGYAKFISDNPLKKEIITKCNKTVKNITYRYNNINNIIYNNNFYINLYITFKNIEEYNYLSEPEEARVQQKAKIFAEKLDNSEAMNYINTQFKDSYKTRSGTLNNLLNKQRKASEG